MAAAKYQVHLRVDLSDLLAVASFSPRDSAKRDAVLSPHGLRLNRRHLLASLDRHQWQ